MKSKSPKETKPRVPQLQIVDVPGVRVQSYWQSKGEAEEDVGNFANVKILNAKLLFYMKKLVSQMSPIFTPRVLNLKLQDKKSPFVRI